jgi:hypothetical protein
LQYTALMADIADSRKLLKKDREKAQVFIKECLDILNGIFKPSLEFKVIFSAGDEIQGLFKSPSSAFLYIRLLKMLLHPLRLNCGMGTGEWDVRIPMGTSSEQDGSSYHNARSAISFSQKKNEWGIIFNSGNENDYLVNTLLDTSLLLVSRQSMKQHRVSLLVEFIHPFFDSEGMDEMLLPGILSLKEDGISGKLPKAEPFHIPSRISGSTLTSTVKRGLSSKIAGITGTTRQNADKVIKSSGVLDIRGIDAAVHLFLKNYHGEVRL